MQPMTEAQRMFSLLFAFILTALGAACFYVVTTNERMALQGYLPHRVEGSVEVFWFKPVPKEKLDIMRGF